MIVALMLSIIATATTAHAESDPRAERARTMYQLGLTAIEEGDYALAKTSFKEVLRLYPKHTQARAKLIYLTNNRNTLEIGKRKAALSKIIIPQVNLDKATIREALEMLSVQVERESKKKITPNFIVQDPTGGFKGRTVTLRLNRLPAETLLRYIVDQAGGHIRYDNHAIIVVPRNKGKAEKPKGDDALLVE